ncbi:hypothetical protein VTK73DRAFT_7223 [Phialemonium thermophilum]|uniref:Peptidase A1 domain-containing protein n=1 Tax=Phialemonium thermophilum TaxID=223376 RepID=A0ABR3WFN1_9PEZI
MKYTALVLPLAGLASATPLAHAVDSTTESSPLRFRFRAGHLPSQPHARGVQKKDVVVSNAVPMRKVTNAGGNNALRSVWKQPLHKTFADGWDLTAETNTTTPAARLRFLIHNQYIVPIQIDDQELQVTVDTGSSDTWVVQSNFSCFDPDVGQIGSEFCSFGPVFNGTFKYGSVPDVSSFALSFSNGEYIGGAAGYDDVTIAGLTVKKQQILLANEAMWAGDGVTSGYLGLGYPLGTQVFSSSDPTYAYPGSPTHRKYDPVFTSMYKQGLVDPVFSIAMNRTSGEGWLAFGGLPPVEHEDDYARAAIRPIEIDNSPATKTENTYYTIVPDGFVFGNLNTSNLTFSNPTWTADFNDTKPSQFPVILNSGLPFSFLPRSVVLPYVLQFSAPVGRFGGQYWAPCNSTVPPFGVTLSGGKTIYLAEADILQQEFTQVQSYEGLPVDLCLIAFMDTLPDGPFYLGDNFLNNFVSVFDVGNSEMRFYPLK